MNNERTPDGKKYYYLFDGLGSIVAMTDGSGHEVNSYDYDPYGNMINSIEQSGLNNPWKFAGGFLDSSTGLYRYDIRYYDPTTGRWIQRTPVGGSLQETTKPNPYVYAADDLVNAVDPSGKDCIGTFVTDVKALLFDARVVDLMTAKIIGACLLFLLCCVMEAGALIEYVFKIASNLFKEKDKIMKNVRLLISVIFLVCAACYLGDFLINGQHPFSSGAAGVSCLLLSILFVVIHIRSGGR